ncbi:hypothetical protein [Aquimarina rubra]|uniref:Lipoprotein n=1 Tax=Aquimarina rubra TaxID=1920033 RepID=A0ABW5LPH9_9FLAO
MKNYLSKLTVFLMFISMTTSCSKDEIETSEQINNQIRQETYLLLNGKKLKLEYDLEEKQYLVSNDYLEFEEIMSNSEDLVIANDGSDVLKIRKLDYYNDNFTSENISKSCCVYSRVTLYEGENYNGENIIFHLNSAYPDYKFVPLKTRCVHGILPVDYSCQVDLTKKVSSVELYDNSYLILKYPNPNPRIRGERFYAFENPGSLSNPDVLRFSLKDISIGNYNLNNRFTSIGKVRFFF